MSYAIVEYFCGVHKAVERARIPVLRNGKIRKEALEPIFSQGIGRQPVLKAVKMGTLRTEGEIEKLLKEHFESLGASRITVDFEGFPNYRGNWLTITKNPGGVNKEMSSEREYKLIPIDLIESSASPSRETFEDIDCLAETIRRHGLLQPVLVKRKDNAYGFEVVFGERRLRACKEAGLEKIPCIIVDGVSQDQVLQWQIIENTARSELRVFELVRLLETLKNHFHLTDDEIGVKTGLSTSSVQNYLTISRLPEQYVRMISHGSHSPTDLTIGKALDLARANLPADKLKETVELVRRKGLSRASLTKKLAQQPSSKIRRVRESRGFWQELTKTLRGYASYWSDFCQLREWEDVDRYHLELHVSLPKDLKESED